MLRNIFTIFFLSLITYSQGQSLPELNKKRLNTNKKGMRVLGAWAVANMVASPILRNSASGSDKYFYDMNLYWNAVNLLIAGAGYIGSVKDDPSAYDPTKSIKAQHQIEKILLFNTALDIGYVATGFFLNERGKRKSDFTLEGYGNSLKLQGAFLAIFDVLFYFAHHKNATKFYELLNHVGPAAQGAGLSVRIKL